MRSLVLLMFFFTASFGNLNFYSKVRNFSMELLYQAVQDSDEDVMISPYVIWYLLMSMAYEAQGVTREQLSKVFLLTENRSEVVTECTRQRTLMIPLPADFATYLFYDEHLNVNLNSIRRLENDFDFITQRLGFEDPQHAADSATITLARYTVPSYSMRTEDFVDSAMIMCNRFFFMKVWSKQFKMSDTVRSYYANGIVDMMHIEAPLRFSNLEWLHASVTELPYSGDTHCTLLVRPHIGYDVHQVFTELRRVSLADILNQLQSDADEFGLRKVEVKLPGNSITTHVVLNKPLNNIGISDAFDPNLANFGNFVHDNDNIFIGEIVHRAEITFTNTFTIVETITPSTTLEYERPKMIIPLEDPFIFFIMEKSTATILIGGSVTKIILS